MSPAGRRRARSTGKLRERREITLLNRLLTATRMKRVLLIPAFVLALGCDAQVDTIPLASSPISRVLFGISASADLCFRVLETVPASSMTATAPWSEEDQTTLGYTAGLKVQYNFTPHWGLGVGAQYADRGYAFERVYHWILVDPVDPVVLGGSNYRFDHRFIDIPVRLIFQTGGKRLRFTASLGVAGNVLLHVSMLSTFTYADGHVTRSRVDLGTGYREVNLSAIGSMGAVLQINALSSIQVEPTFRANLFPINEGANRPTLRSAGLELTYFHALR